MESRRLARRDGPEGEGGEDAEVAAACAAQRPEQVRFAMLIALDDAAIRQHYLCCEQAVRGEPVFAAEDAEPAAQGEAGDSDRRTASGRDGEAVFVQRVVHVSEPGASSYPHHAAGDRHRAHWAYIDYDPLGRGAPCEAVPAAADHRLKSRAPGEGDRLGNVLRSLAKHEGLRLDVLEAGYGRSAGLLVVW